MFRRQHTRALRILLATNAMILLAGAMIGPIYALFVEEIGGDIMDAGLTAGIFALAAGITTLIAGRYADRIKESELIVVVGYLVLGAGFLLYTQVSTIYMLFAVQVFIGIAEAIYWPAFDALYTKHINRRRAGREWGRWEAMSYFTYALGSAVGALIATYLGFNVLFVVMALLCAASAIYIYFLPRKAL